MRFRGRYPKNWKALATGIKEAAGWKCQKCGLQCLRPDEDVSELEKSERTARTLTVHHFDRVPENSDPENLIAVCTPCHLDYHRGGLGNVSPGQLSLFGAIVNR
ncbi:HNH endonuclease signature motif containing protein [Pannus brasiliensis CCIBt3594]|uniref:HNH endonuclease signature motif containing protein n=1 Tax=Pannus brasiliensis CCIBt3594 TaxID=1427578 RepID=A0AAW9QXX2_9CHRO